MKSGHTAVYILIVIAANVAGAIAWLRVATQVPQTHGVFAAGEAVSAQLEEHPRAVCVMLLSLALIIFSLAALARAKGRSMAWSVLAIIPLIGVITVLLLRARPKEFGGE